jgi:CheY-like chemotaxis protein
VQDQLASQLQPETITIQRRSILIVDDEESTADVLAVRLDRQGYDTCVARSGSEGLAMARTLQPDLIVLDLRLPDVDGFTVCQRLVDSPETGEIPVIILSGMERPDIIRRSRAAGCRYFVRKPYDPNALLVLIEQSIGEAEPFGI